MVWALSWNFCITGVLYKTTTPIFVFISSQKKNSDGRYLLRRVRRTKSSTESPCSQGFLVMVKLSQAVTKSSISKTLLWASQLQNFRSLPGLWMLYYTYQLLSNCDNRITHRVEVFKRNLYYLTRTKQTKIYLQRPNPTYYFNIYQYIILSTTVSFNVQQRVWTAGILDGSHQ